MRRRTVSLCMIARNEEATIGQAIKSAMALVDEIVLVDTGSSDNTRVIAEGYGARILELPWRDDFSRVRNAGLAVATGEWILVLDADERLLPVRPIEFQALLRVAATEAYRFRVLDPLDRRAVTASEPVRLFRNSPELRYRHRVYERLLPRPTGRGGRALAVRDCDLALLHDGPRGPLAALRRERNQKLLAAALAEQPEEPYFAYLQGREGVPFRDDEALPTAGLAAAGAALTHAWRLVCGLPASARARLDYAPDLAARLAACLIAAGKPEAARAHLLAAREQLGDHPRLLAQEVAALTALLRAGLPAAAPERARGLLAEARDGIHRLCGGPEADSGPEPDPRLRTVVAPRYLGELLLLEGRVAEAAEAFERVLTADAACSHAWLGLAECARYAGDRKRALQLYLRTVTEDERNHRGWLRGSSLMEELGFRDNAASWRRQVAVLFPEHPDLATQRRRQADPVPCPPVGAARGGRRRR